MIKNVGLLFYAAVFLALVPSCSIQKKIAAEARQDILSQADFAPAHVGISLYEPATGKYLFNHDGDKLFIPASNMKLFTCYEAMKNLGDSLIGLRYVDKGDEEIEIEGCADPSFLVPEFSYQPVYSFLKNKKHIILTDNNWKENALGAGWAWDDYNSDYMAERSALPIYGNLVRFRKGTAFRSEPAGFEKQLVDAMAVAKTNFMIRREMGSNNFIVRPAILPFSAADIPFSTPGNQLLIRFLSDTLRVSTGQSHTGIGRSAAVKKIYTQPTDSLLKKMMHRSDNFFAEQTLLMISNEKLGYMSDAAIIDTLLKTDLVGLPQKPKWVDGSGLSRYNLISPQDFTWVLSQMLAAFNWDRIKEILPTGGEGTLSAYYKKYAGRIYAKTGSLSNHIALSGYLATNKGRRIVFSVLVNAYLVPAANIRKGVEKFLIAVMEKY